MENRERPITQETVQNSTIIAQNFVNLNSRDARFLARDMAHQLAQKNAEVAILKA